MDEKRVAFITGGTSGIGKEVALTLAKEGFNIAINCINEPKNYEDLKKEIEANNVKCILVQGDVSIYEDTETMVKEVINEYGKIDVLVNNAGITRDNLLMRMKKEDFNAVIDVNLIGTFNVTKNVVPYMIKQRYGRIISLASVVGVAGNAGQANYAASKAGIIGFTKSLAKELGSRNILVNAVAPGYIKTAMTDVLSDKIKDSIKEQIPLRTLGETKDVANLIKFLSSEDSSYITGQVIHVDGRYGYVIKRRRKMERRVVVTGLGAITPIGNTVDEFWKGIKECKCGIDEITLFDNSNFKAKLAAEVKNFNLEEYFDRKTAKRLDRFSHFAIVASRELMKDSKIDTSKTDMTRFGVLVSSGIGGIQTIEENHQIYQEKGPDRISPMFIPMSTINMAAGNISIEVGAKGESFSLVTACASSTNTIGEAYRIIKHGYQDLIIAGGTEACITPLGIGGFTNIKALSTCTNKKRASIPFDKERSGFIMGEGAGLILLEEYEHAKKRNAKIYAEMCGYGATSDAYHITSPSPDGEGGARAMVNAMNDAHITPEQLDYINTHGTSTHLNDKFETIAIKRALGEASKKVMISSTKGNTGHLLGAAGAVEAIATIKALQEGFVPPTIGYEVPDEECDLDVVPNVGRNIDIKYAMSDSLGFGGHNGAIMFKKFEE